MVLAAVCIALFAVFLILPAGRALSQETIEVIVRKPNPPVGGACDRAEAVYRYVPDSAPSNGTSSSS